jgi:hypothetical protein
MEMEKRRFSVEELKRARAVDPKKYGIDGNYENAIDAVMANEDVSFVDAVKRLLSFAETHQNQNIATTASQKQKDISNIVQEKDNGSKAFKNYYSDLDKHLDNVIDTNPEEEAERLVSLPKDEWAKEMAERFEAKRARALEKEKLSDIKNDNSPEWLRIGENNEDIRKAEALEMLGANSIADALRMPSPDIAKAICSYAEIPDLTPEALDSALRQQWAVMAKVMKKISNTFPELEEKVDEAYDIIHKTYEKLNPPVATKEYEPPMFDFYMDDILNPTDHLSKSVTTTKTLG